MKHLYLLLLLTACATTIPPHAITAMDGGTAYYVECRSMVACHEAARRQCESYVPLGDNRRSSVVGSVIGGDGAVRTVYTFELTFRCR